MIDEKKLIAEIREKIRPESFGEQCNSLDVIYAMLQLIDEQPKVGEWIPCSERLPEERSEAVLATAYDGISTAIYVFYYENGRWKDIDGYNVDAAEITAWMPMPDPWEERNK